MEIRFHLENLKVILSVSSPPLPLFLKAPVPKSALIPVIPITKSTGSRFRNSVEGLNQEIEIIIKETGEKEEQLIVSGLVF